MRQYYMRINYGTREAEDDFVIFYCPEYITRGKFQDTAKLVTNYEVRLCDFDDDYIEYATSVCSTIAKKLNAVWGYAISEYTFVVE